MIRLYNAEGLAIMEMLIAKNIVIDAIITDLPYGTTACKWDSIIPLVPMWKLSRQLLKENGVFITTASQPFTSILISSNLQMFKYEWIWHKNKASGHLNAKKMPMKAHENIVVFGKGKINYYPQKTENNKPMNYAVNNNHISNVYGNQKRVITKGGSILRYPRSVLDFAVVNNDSTNEKRYHPTQKPIKLIEYLIKTYTRENELVLDFTMGSGTMGEACKSLNRNFIGVELDTETFKIAKNRILNSP